MSGNVGEWNDLDGTVGSSRGVRGGGWEGNAFGLSSSFRNAAIGPSFGSYDVGFRLAAVPEPSTYASALAGLACGGYSMFRRRKRA